jgi:hypothetical protein
MWQLQTIRFWFFCQNELMVMRHGSGRCRRNAACSPSAEHGVDASASAGRSEATGNEREGAQRECWSSALWREGFTFTAAHGSGTRPLSGLERCACLVLFKWLFLRHRH